MATDAPDTTVTIRVEVVVVAPSARTARAAVGEALIAYDWIEDVRFPDPRGGYIL